MKGFCTVKLRRFNEIFGWETWTRTRIARSRVWSPTNWTISQPGEKIARSAARQAFAPPLQSF